MLAGRFVKGQGAGTAEDNPRAFAKSRLQVWGGVECTINRVGDRYFSQLELSGHRTRLSDLERFAELGLRTIRFPILWEELAPDSPDSIDWRQVDAQFESMRQLGIEPIAGLIHHGSGPRYTSLVDPHFPEKLAKFARQVAGRYPWINAFTPVNEPLTTARFSGLYSHWYPHGRDGFTFVRALFNQIRGVVLAMRAIREVNPRAALVQTEDLGKTFSSSRLRYQADFENERRWLTWDLLCGRVNRDHPLWSYLLSLGAEEQEISIFEEEPCPPQIIGVNHYVTSERFLDENLRDYPPERHGGNERERYADVEAVRVPLGGESGPGHLLRETCDRYGLPVAVTEAHIACTREEQMRWFKEIWDAAEALRDEGRDIRAVTAWSLLGAFNWNSLLTREENHYEPGAFDLRGTSPRPTAIAKMICELAQGNAFNHPALNAPGWWRRPMRLDWSMARHEQGSQVNQITSIAGHLRKPIAFAEGRPILITGGGGRLARAFARALELRGLLCRALTRNELDIARESEVGEAFQALSPWAVVNCAGFSRVDEAEGNEQACLRSNVQGAENLARACARNRAQLLTFSSDFVFDGAKTELYLESDACEGLNIYGKSKIVAEAKVLAALPGSLVIRLGKVFAPNEESDLFRDRLEALARGERVQAANDVKFSAAYLPDLVSAALDLLIDGESDIWHLTNAGAVTAEEFLFAAANLANLDTTLIEGVPVWSLSRLAPRPRNRALGSARGQLLPPLQDALWRYIHHSPLLSAAERQAALL